MNQPTRAGTLSARLDALEARVQSIEAALPDRVAAILIASHEHDELEGYRAIKGLGKRIGLALLIAAGTMLVAAALNGWLT